MVVVAAAAAAAAAAVKFKPAIAVFVMSALLLSGTDGSIASKDCYQLQHWAVPRHDAQTLESCKVPDHQEVWVDTESDRSRLTAEQFAN